MHLDRDPQAFTNPRQLGLRAAAVFCVGLALNFYPNKISPPEATEPGAPAAEAAAEDDESFESIMSYPGWEQYEITAEDIDYSPYTGIFHYGHAPTRNGGVALYDIHEESHRPSAIAAAHKAGRKIYMVVGGEGLGGRFSEAANPDNRAKFITNMLNTMRPDGGYRLDGGDTPHYYDGLIIDWEEGVDGSDQDNVKNYVALVKETRAALEQLAADQAIDRPYLGVDVISGLNPPEIVARFDEFVDSIDIMSYEAGWEEEVPAYTSAGIPEHKLILGIGLSGGYHDKTRKKVLKKVNYVKDLGLKGVEAWQIGDLKDYNEDPRLKPLHGLVNND